MKIIWRKSAEIDLNKAFDYLLDRNPQAALRTFGLIRQKVELLANHPHLGRAGRVADTRELVMAGTPYIVIYTVEQMVETVIILRVLHGKKRWPEETSETDE